MKKTLLVLAMMMATGSVYAAGASSTAAVGDSVTAPTILSAGATSGTATAATDDDTLKFIDNAGASDTSAVGTTTATLNSQNVDNPIETNSFNAVTKGSRNQTNSFNSTTIGGDGNVVHANDMDQAVAESDLNVHLIDNEVNIAGAQTTDIEGAQVASPALNGNLALNYSNTNAISGSYARLSGVSSLQFNAASSANVQQSIVVASDVGL